MKQCIWRRDYKIVPFWAIIIINKEATHDFFLLLIRTLFLFYYFQVNIQKNILYRWFFMTELKIFQRGRKRGRVWGICCYEVLIQPKSSIWMFYYVILFICICILPQKHTVFETSYQNNIYIIEMTFASWNTCISNYVTLPNNMKSISTRGFT